MNTLRNVREEMINKYIANILFDNRYFDLQVVSTFTRLMKYKSNKVFFIITYKRQGKIKKNCNKKGKTFEKQRTS